MMQESSKNQIYLDYNATTPLADEVITDIHRSMVEDWGNPSSSHEYGLQARDAITKARQNIQEMLSAPLCGIIFTSGGTEANNMIINGTISYFENTKEPKLPYNIPHVVTTNVEHDSILNPLVHLESKEQLEFTSVKVDKDGALNVEDVMKEVRDNTCLITVMMANNETGVIMPIAELGSAITNLNSQRRSKMLPEVLFHSDAAQIIGKEPVNVSELQLDYITIVGHKLYGPRIGCVWARAQLYPMLFGGGQEEGLRPGTENTPMIVGLGRAAELVTSNIDKYSRDMQTARNYLEERLAELFGDGVVFNCKANRRLPNTCNMSFVRRGLVGRKVLSHCRRLIAGVGAACHGTSCSQVLLNSGVSPELAENAIRLSVGRNTTTQEIDVVVDDLKQAMDAILEEEQPRESNESTGL